MILTTLALALPILMAGQSGEDIEKATQELNRLILEQYQPAFQRAASELPAAITEARRLGMPLTVDDLPAPPARFNGAHVPFPPQEMYLKRGPLQEAFVQAWLDNKNRDWEGDPFLAALEEGLAMPDWHLSREWQKGPFVLFPEASSLNRAATSLGERAVARAKAGRREDALRDLHLMREMAERLGREWSSFGVFFSNVHSVRQERSALRLLQVWRTSPASREMLRQTLLGSRTSLNFEAAFHGDLLNCLAAARSEEALGGIFALGLAEGGVTEQGNLAFDRPEAWPTELVPRTLEGKAMAARALQAFTRNGPPSAQAMDKVRTSLFAQLAKGDMASWLLYSVLFSETTFVEIETNLAARRRLTDAAFFLAENPGHTGPLPQVDPWSGEPLKRTVKGRKASIWSVGPDGKSAGPFFAPRQRDDADDHSIVIDLPAAQP